MVHETNLQHLIEAPHLALALILGAALGGLIRYLLHTKLGPYKGTLTANITASLILGTQTTPPDTYTTFLTNEQFYQQLTTHFFIATGLCVALSTSGTVHLGGTPQQMITAEQTIHQAKRATTYLATTITLSLLAYHLGSILSLSS